LINPDEFEEIAEIYDSIRLLHARVNPQLDPTLAADFDARLREVMEALSQAVNSEELLRETKKERSITAKVDLLTMCAEKISEYLSSTSHQDSLNGVFLGIFDGLRDAYADLQTSQIELCAMLTHAR